MEDVCAQLPKPIAVCQTMRAVCGGWLRRSEDYVHYAGAAAADVCALSPIDIADDSRLSQRVIEDRLARGSVNADALAERMKMR